MTPMALLRAGGSKQRRLQRAVGHLADEDGILIAGHLRVAAAAKLKLTSIPVVVASEAEKNSYRLADKGRSEGSNSGLLNRVFREDLFHPPSRSSRSGSSRNT